MVVAPKALFVPRPAPEIAWVKPPADFVLDDTPVDNLAQPLIAAALSESLELTGRLPASGLVASNFGLCVRVGNELTLKAPDWLYIEQVIEPGLARKSYTPHLEGDVPDIVMEFLSETEGGEYSIRQTTPVGKWHFYEQILKVPNYIILEPDAGLLEVYRLQNDQYVLEQPDIEGRHWFAELGLFLGAWRGFKGGHHSYWLRWWDAEGNLLPWAVEQMEQDQQQVSQERQQTEQERKRADTEKQRADAEKQRADAAQLKADAAQLKADEAQLKAERLANLLRAQGINPDEL
jgi:Putative restriction endonuclease